MDHIPDYEEEFAYENRNKLSRGKVDLDYSYVYGFGRNKIEIPLSKETLNSINIQKWLPYCLRQHSLNVADICHQEDVYKGKTRIFDKIRPISTEKKNNIVSEITLNTWLIGKQAKWQVLVSIMQVWMIAILLF